MGWKRLKEHYQIVHNVRVEDGNFCIGSDLMHDIIVIRPDGTFAQRNDRPSSNAHLDRYQREMDADPAKLLELINQPDEFEKSVLIYTSYRDQIIEQFCEVPEWGNVTHCGQMIFENTHSTDKDVVIGWAFANARARVEMTTETLEDAKAHLAKLEARNAGAIQALASLQAAYPDQAAKAEVVEV